MLHSPYLYPFSPLTRRQIKIKAPFIAFGNKSNKQFWSPAGQQTNINKRGSINERRSAEKQHTGAVKTSDVTTSIEKQKYTFLSRDPFVVSYSNNAHEKSYQDRLKIYASKSPLMWATFCTNCTAIFPSSLHTCLLVHKWLFFQEVWIHVTVNKHGAHDDNNDCIHEKAEELQSLSLSLAHRHIHASL